ncbi:MAG TPA: M48 family metallopeptidase [Stellaceae bacterium]|nr:M48 family metallopeptidase [Stellaceae bacterium]
MTEVAPEIVNTDFEAAIARNKRNTVILIVVLTLIAAVLGYVLGWAWGMLDLIWSLPPRALGRLTAGGVLADLFHLPPRREAVIGTLAMIAFGVGWGLVTLYAGARILSAFIGARDADPANPLEKQFIDVVEEMSIAAGLPMPRPMVVDTAALNAFASGSSPGRAMVTATAGILQTCTREELQGVIGHEMSHVLDFDVRYATVVAAMAGVTVMLQHLLLNMARWGPMPSGGRRDDDSGGQRGLLTLVVMAVVLVFALIAPLAAKLVQLAISRQREYLADATSVKLTRNPVGLIHALQRLQQSDTAMTREDSPVAALCIAPIRSFYDNAFATHPPLEDRIARLQNLGGIPISPTTRSDEAAPPPPHHGPWG